MTRSKYFLMMLFAALFVFNGVAVTQSFADQQGIDMEKMCPAAKKGTEADLGVRRACAAHFEQTGESLAVGAAADAASTPVITADRIARLFLKIAVIGAAIAVPTGG